jgi:hypothetical protein
MALSTTVRGSFKFRAEPGVTIEPIVGVEDHEPDYLISVVAEAEAGDREDEAAHLLHTDAEDALRLTCDAMREAIEGNL